MRLAKILLVLSMLISAAGCAATQAATPQRPTKPVITAEEHDGMVCFSEDDAYLLYLYILDLEEEYDK